MCEILGPIKYNSVEPPKASIWSWSRLVHHDASHLEEEPEEFYKGDNAHTDAKAEEASNDGEEVNPKVNFTNHNIYMVPKS